jgi:predicted nucleic acid-binding protein
LSAVVQMELRTGARTPRARRAVDELVRAYRGGRRIVVPTARAFDEAGRALRELRDRGVEVRRASLVNDVLIAQSARAIGAMVITRDRDYETLKAVFDFGLQVLVN